MADVAGATPEQYALRVRTHPGVLQISASNKIRRATEVRVSWSGRLVESYELSKDKGVIESNFGAAKRLVDELGEPSREKQGEYFLWNDVPLDSIERFLNGFQ